MTVQPRPRTQVLAGLFLGAVALGLITALLTAAVSSSSADGKLGGAITKLDAAVDQLEVMRAKQSQLQDDLDAQRLGTVKARKAAVLRDEELRRRLYVLTVFLRRQGYAVPNLAPPSGENRPKVRRPTSPASPTPTAPSPSAPSPNPSLSCRLVPQLCRFPITLPTIP